jgi:hypothetical protein
MVLQVRLVDLVRQASKPFQSHAARVRSLAALTAGK